MSIYLKKNIRKVFHNGKEKIKFDIYKKNYQKETVVRGNINSTGRVHIHNYKERNTIPKSKVYTINMNQIKNLLYPENSNFSLLNYPNIKKENIKKREDKEIKYINKNKKEQNKDIKKNIHKDTKKNMNKDAKKNIHKDAKKNIHEDAKKNMNKNAKKNMNKNTKKTIKKDEKKNKIRKMMVIPEINKNSLHKITSLTKNTNKNTKKNTTKDTNKNTTKDTNKNYIKKITKSNEKMKKNNKKLNNSSIKK